LGKPKLESLKNMWSIARNSQMKMVILIQNDVFWAKNTQNDQFKATIPQ